MLDANARVGSIESLAIGTAGAEIENIAGQHFHQWLHDSALFFPQTFEAFHQGDHFTWAHSPGSTSRLDFVAVDASLRTDAIKSYITPVDLTITKERSQKCVCVEIPLRCLLGTSETKTRQPRQQDGDLHPPTITWSTDVHSHAALLQNWMQQHVPRPHAAVRRKAHLTDATWILIRQKR